LSFATGRGLARGQTPDLRCLRVRLLSVRALTGAIAKRDVSWRAHGKAALGFGHLCATDLADFFGATGTAVSRRAPRRRRAGARSRNARRANPLSYRHRLLVGAHASLSGPELARAPRPPKRRFERRSLIGGPAKVSGSRSAISEARARCRRVTERDCPRRRCIRVAGRARALGSGSRFLPRLAG